MKKLFKVLYKKELIYWNRINLLFHDMEDIGSKIISYPIMVILLSIIHYCFIGMHFLFELFLYIFNRKQFNKNMNSLIIKLYEKTKPIN